jgi:murein DD-endopeptidase MepM/ murein hydrolase activator NlpD
MVADLDRLTQALTDRKHKFDLLEDLLLYRQLQADTRPAGRPVAEGWISSTYGWRRDPFTGRKDLHRGLDFVGETGSDILAVADGVVHYAGLRSGYGLTVEIRHGNGFLTRYAHNSTLAVSRGDLVRQGQVIAAMGNTGRSTGTHLHFEVVRDDQHEDPMPYIKTGRREPEDS